MTTTDAKKAPAAPQPIEPEVPAPELVDAAPDEGDPRPKGKPGKTLTDPSRPDPERAERLYHVLWLFLDDKWEPGVTAPTLAAEWNVSIPTVERLGVEARGICRVVRRFADSSQKSASELGEVRKMIEGIAERLVMIEGSMKGAEAKSLERKLREMARGKPDAA